MAVPGVQRVEATTFRRWREPDRGELAAGRMQLGALEIARLDDDASRPENGRLAFTMVGGI
jgi:hypothetical protein